MSFDLILWVGSPADPSRYWFEIQEHKSKLPVLPHERLVAAFRDAFGANVASGIVGRGWELATEGAWTSIVCDWSVANDPNALARFVKAAHAGGCSVYDPQFGAYWPAAVGLPEAGADAWASAFFDQGFVFDDEADEGHVPETPMRLCPDDVRPVTQQVWIDVHVVAEGPLVRGLMSHRAQLYRARFPSWTITVRLGGSGAQTLRPSDCARWLERAKAKAEVVEGSDAPSIAFAVLGDFDARELAGRLEICPFELVPFSREDKLLASAFGEPVASVAVIVPKRVVASAPEVLRTALHALGDAIASLAGGASVHFADPAQADANVGANLAWVEAHVGLVPSEPIRAIAASDVPKVAVEGVSEDDEDKNK